MRLKAPKEGGGGFRELMRLEEAPGSLKNVSFLNKNMLQCALVRGGQSNWLWTGKQIKNIVVQMASKI